MLDAIQRQPLVALLAFAVAALVVVIGLETGFGSRFSPAIPAEPTRAAAPFEAKLMPPLAATDPDRTYPEMAARPLFVPLRRPAPPADPVAQSNFKPGQYTLSGVIIAGDTRIAMLREKGNNSIHRVEKGQEVVSGTGLKVAEITPESVTLAQGKDQEVLPLKPQKVAPGSVAPPLPGPFGPPVPGAPGAPGVAPAHPPAAPATAQFGPVPAGVQPGAANPAAGTVPQATTTPMTPEELLARRRARRAQQAE